MRRCSCGRASADDQHWCAACGAYLAFDEPSESDAARPPEEGAAEQPAPTATATALADAPARADVVLLLRRTDSHVYLNPDEPPLEVQVAAGGRALVRALLRNQGVQVDGYDVQIEGADPAWFTVTPARLGLIPFGTREGYEDEVEVALHPPRAPQAEARVWSLLLVVRSRRSARVVASAPLLMRIEPYHRLEAGVHPQIVTGRRRARYTSTLRNGGNSAVVIVLSAADPEDACRFDFVASRLALAPGDRVASPFVGRPRRQIWLGRPREHRFEVAGQVQEEPEVMASVPATLRQRPWLPWWLAIVVPLLALAIVALILLLGDDDAASPQVTVPSVRGIPTRLEVRQELARSQLKLADEVGRDDKPGYRVWTVIGQSPPAGEKVAPGSEVSIVVQGPPLVKVPPLHSKTAPDAEQLLVGARLKLGKVEPGPDPELRVVSQIPKAGTKRRPGTAVDIVLAKPKPKAGGKGKGGKDGKAGTDGAKGGGAAAAAAAKAKAKAKAKVKVPKFEDAALPDYGEALAKAGLVAATQRQISARARGAVLATTPKPGTEVDRGAKVRVVVSAGFPRLAYDDGANVLLAGGASGAPRVRLASGPPSMTEPTWTADRRRIAYSAGRALFVTPARAGSSARQITPIGSRETYAHPAFAPTSQRDVLAFVHKDDDADELCLTAVGRTGARRPNCMGLPGWTLDVITWAPGGGMLLIGASRRSAPSQFGLLVLTTDRPYTIQSDDWGRSTDTPAQADVPGVRVGRISPDRKRLAVIRARGDGTFRLALTAADDLKLEQAKILRVAACDVAWRPDGRELAVVQAGPTCPAGAPGTIVRLSPSRPSSVVTVGLKGLHPAWEPISLGPS